MTAFLDPDDVHRARERAGAHGLSPVEAQRWDAVLAYCDSRPCDPSAERAAALRAHVGEGSDREVFDLASRADDPVVRRLCRAWLDDDIAAAAPLMELFTGHHKDPVAAPAPPPARLADALRAWFEQRSVVLEELHVLSGGFSRLMLEARWAGGSAIIRIEQHGLFATDGDREATVMRILGRLGYPIPAVLWEEPAPAVVGQPFFVMERVPGAARKDAAGLDDVLRALAALHGLDPSELATADGLASGASPEQVVQAQLEHWHEVYRAAVPTTLPLLERAFTWLEKNLHPTGPPVIVHGDPGPGNVLQDASGIRAVIDWELAHVGDPAEDWAYLALIRGRRIGTPAEWKRRLRRTVGVRYDERTWRAWEAFNQVKGACINLTALDVVRRIENPTPDLCAIGVAVHLRFLARAVELTDG